MISINENGEVVYTNPALETHEAIQGAEDAVITDEERISALESAFLELAEVVFHG